MAAGIVSSEQVSQCIDALCQCGCDAVRATISAMESGVEVPQVKTLSNEERRMVLDELKAVMAVYDARS
jgi:4-hydroxy-3-methylbut-2-en-1-yl diphosphate synthase IspG/GcpE